MFLLLLITPSRPKRRKLIPEVNKKKEMIPGMNNKREDTEGEEARVIQMGNLFV